jgi:multidrug resistance efflux pump
MSILQRLIADVSHSTAQLVAQLRELDLLREQVEKAQLLADGRQNRRQTDRRRQTNRKRMASRSSLKRPNCTISPDGSQPNTDEAVCLVSC